jgi:hypothetical protein
MAVLVYEPKVCIALAELEDELARAFATITSALDHGEAVVVSLRDRDVQGVGEPADAALAHGLLGLSRALATEGGKAGWRIAVLSSTPDVDPAERQRWIERLSEPGAAQGVILRLGREHLGRVPA